MRRVGHVLERLDARHEVERVVREREELVRDDVGDAVRVARDVEPDAPRLAGKRSSYGRDPHQTSSTSSDGLRQRARAPRRSPPTSSTEVEVVGLRRRRMAARAADGVERLGRGDHRAARHSELHCRPARRQGKWRRAHRGVSVGDDPSSRCFPWGDVGHDFLDRSGSRSTSFATSSRAAGCSATSRRWLTAGVATAIVCPTTSVSRRGARCTPHRSRGSSSCRRRAASATARRGARRARRGPPQPRDARARRRGAHVAPYLSTPPPQSRRLLRRGALAAVLCQDYETPRFDVCVAGPDGALGLPVYATFQGGDEQYSRLERLDRPRALRRVRRALSCVRTPRRARVSRPLRPPAEPKSRGIPNPVDLSVWGGGEPRRGRAPRSASPAAPGSSPGTARCSSGARASTTLLDAWRLVRRQLPGADLRLVLVGAGEDLDELPPADRRPRSLEGVRRRRRLGRRTAAGSRTARGGRRLRLPLAPRGPAPSRPSRRWPAGSPVVAVGCPGRGGRRRRRRARRSARRCTGARGRDRRACSTISSAREELGAARAAPRRGASTRSEAVGAAPARVPASAVER